MTWNPFQCVSDIVRARLLPVGLGLLVGATGLSGCASSAGGIGGSAAVDGRSSSATDCIFSRSVRDYTTLDDRNLILDAPGNRAYHVVLATPSINIESEFMIGVVDGDGDGRICPFGRDRILIAGPIRERIPIRSIEEINETDVEGLKVEFGLSEAAADDAVTVTEIE